METALITRADDETVGRIARTIMVYRHAGGTWVFVAHEDPGLDFVVTPRGIEKDVYEPFGDRPGVIPEALWNQYMEDCINPA